jgi:hypothetical protein
MLTPDANPFDPDGVYRPNRPTSASDAKDPFLPAALHRASAAEFEADCQRLAAGG